MFCFKISFVLGIVLQGDGELLYPSSCAVLSTGFYEGMTASIYWELFQRLWRYYLCNCHPVSEEEGYLSQSAENTRANNLMSYFRSKWVTDSNLVLLKQNHLGPE